MKNRKIWGTGCWSLAITFAVVLIAFPFVLSMSVRWSGTYSQQSMRMLALADDFLSWSMLGLAAAWVFFLGACFASFLNVVAWRVPRGMSILGSSRCPNCQTKLSFRDNIPIVGWLRIGGRCSSCRAPIAIRYLLVELLLGSIFVVVVGMELASGGVTLPLRTPDRFTELGRMFFEPQPDLVQIVGFHLLMVLALFLFSLVEYGHKLIPWSIAAVSMLLGVMFGLLFPGSLILPWQFPFAAAALPDRINLVITMAIGIATGYTAGIAMAPLIRMQPHVLPGNSFDRTFTEPTGDDERTTQPHPTASGIGLAHGLAIVGLFLGWQSVLVIAVAFSALIVLPGTRARIQADRAVPNQRSLAILLATTIFYLVIWRCWNLLALFAFGYDFTR